MKRADPVATPARRATAVVAVALVLGACGAEVGDGADGGAAAGSATAADLVHIHRLQEAPDGGLYVATHLGLFKVDGSRIESVGDATHDLMGFTVAGANDLLASGHPDLRVDELLVDDKPPLLGLARSTDGTAWEPLSLLGDVDFHALVTAHGQVYGLDSQTGALMVSADRKTWETRSKALPFIDIAVSPDDPDMLVATGQEGLARSDDGGRSWANLKAKQAAAVLSWTEQGLFAVSPNGDVMQSEDNGKTWQSLGTVDGSPAALLVTDDSIFVAVHEVGIVRSTDAGKSFDVLISTGESTP